MTTHTKALTEVAIGAYLVVFGVLAGMVVDRMVYDHQREEVLSRYEHALTVGP